MLLAIFLFFVLPRLQRVRSRLQQIHATPMRRRDLSPPILPITHFLMLSTPTRHPAKRCRRCPSRTAMRDPMSRARMFAGAAAPRYRRPAREVCRPDIMRAYARDAGRCGAARSLAPHIA